MGNVTQTPNMNLPNPVPGVDPGPDYANNLQSCINILDQHNHSITSGVQINPSGININTALPFNNQQATGVQAILFQDQTSLATLNALYTIGSDLWYNDSTQPVQITKAGSVFASSSGIVSGSASASFVSNVLTVLAATNTPANIQGASILLGLNSSGTNYLTLSPPAALSGGSYTLTLPTINPAGTFFLTMDNAGNFGTASGIFPSQIASASITGSQIASATITAANIATGTITRIQEAPVGQAISSSTGNYSSSATSFTQITNLSEAITTTGRPVMIMIQPDGTTNSASVGNNNASAISTIRILRGSTTVSQFVVIGSPGDNFPSFICMDTPSAGFYSYQIQVMINNGSFVFSMANCAMVLYEL